MMKPMAKPARTITARAASFSSPEPYHCVAQSRTPTLMARPTSGYLRTTASGTSMAGGARMPHSILSRVHNNSLRPIAAPASSPSHMAQPAGDECSTGLKKPPVVQPPASAAPMPSRLPPAAAQRYSRGGGRLGLNCRDNNAALNAPMTSMMFISDMRCSRNPSSSFGTPNRGPSPIRLLNQSPQNLTPPNTPQTRPLTIRPMITSTSSMAPANGDHSSTKIVR